MCFFIYSYIYKRNSIHIQPTRKENIRPLQGLEHLGCHHRCRCSGGAHECLGQQQQLCARYGRLGRGQRQGE